MGTRDDREDTWEVEGERRRKKKQVPSTHLLNHEELEISATFTSTKWKVLVVFTTLLSVACLVWAIVLHVIGNNMNIPKGIAEPYTKMTSARSCRDIVSDVSGLYLIQPNEKDLPFYTYCDTLVDGGGWTLVASIHENDIYGKCTMGDRWSNELAPTSGDKISTSEKKLKSLTSWENYETFGNVQSATSSDYKNAAYFDYKSKDLMIWHVKSDTNLNKISEEAFLKYFTQDHFLAKHGDNLQSFFHNHYPIRETVGGLEGFLKAISSSTRKVMEQLPYVHLYTYDVMDDHTIVDGGGDMYDEGNKIMFKLNENDFNGPLLYDKSYFFFDEEVEVNVRTGYPFKVITWIGNSKMENTTAQIRVKSDFGADGRGGLVIQGRTNISHASVSGEYFVYNLVNATTDPSVCEVYFYFGSPNWGSVFPSYFQLETKIQTTREADNIITISGKFSNIMFGYTLLSKTEGRRVTRLEVEEVLKDFMEHGDNLDYTFPGVSYSSKVKYERGNDEEVISNIPTDEQDKVEAGYLQFRVYNEHGVPFAFCPGVRTTSRNPERFCVGTSVDAYNIEKNACSDFAS